MIRSLYHDARLYLLLIGMQIRAQWQYKVNLALDIGTYFGVSALELASILLFFTAFPTLLGWQVGEVTLLASIVSISFGLAEIVGSGIDNFSWMVQRGEFDRVLLRPIGALTQVAGSDFRLRRLGRLTQGCAGFVIAHLWLPHLHWTWDKIIALPLSIVIGTVIFVSILLLGATLCFWTVETTEITNILTYGGREMMSYPITIYHQLLQRFFFFVVPIAFASFVPTCYLLERPLPFGLPVQLVFAAPLAAFLFALAAMFVWRFGVQHYQSTGS
ncbi:MAG: ABC-2 family transporter protein [Ktedonobacteraceae bacterium]|nr:ABC-2 family transporter protein [Ktedonobacteraceae bacterium]